MCFAWGSERAGTVTVGAGDAVTEVARLMVGWRYGGPSVPAEVAERLAYRDTTQQATNCVVFAASCLGGSGVLDLSRWSEWGRFMLPSVGSWGNVEVASEQVGRPITEIGADGVESLDPGWWLVQMWSGTGHTELWRAWGSGGGVTVLECTDRKPAGVQVDGALWDGSALEATGGVRWAQVRGRARGVRVT